MSEFKKRLEDLQEKIQAKKLEKAKLEERRSALEKEQEKMNSQLKELGITSQEQLDSKIQELSKDLTDRLTETENGLN